MSQHIIPKRAHTPEQKRAIIERLFKLWLEYPELRLGQLIFNCFKKDFYYMEDFTLIEALEKTYRQSTKEQE